MNKNQKGFSAIEGLLILIVVGLIATFGVIVYRKHHKVTTTNSVSTTKTTTPASPPITNKTFTNDSYGLSFAYPTSASVTDTTAQTTGSDVNVYPWYERSDYVKLDLTLNSLNSEAKLVVNNTDLTVTSGSMNGGTKQTETFMVNGLKAYGYNWTGPMGSSTGAEYVVVGPKYSFVVVNRDGTQAAAIKSLAESVQLK